MARVVDFYGKLPRGIGEALWIFQHELRDCTGAPPAVNPSGLIGRYQAKYFGDKPSAMRRYSVLMWPLQPAV
jgi:hypothetical protein